MPEIENPKSKIQNPKSAPGFLHRVFFVLKFLEIRLRFIAILVVTAVVVGYWDHIQNYYERWQRTHQAGTPLQTPEAVASETEYYCGMHPFVVRDRPGKCPICGMELTPRKKGAPQELPEGVLARVQSSPERIMQAGVQIEPALYHFLTRTVRSYGVIEVDQAKLAKIVARFPGRIEELMVNSVGAVVKKGEPLARIYSPKYLAASEEYLRVLGTQRTADSAAVQSPEEKARGGQLADAARRRLHLAGFTEEQLDVVAQSGKVSDSITLYSPLSGTVIEKSALLGQTVEEGTALYMIAELSPLWVQVQVLEADIAAVKIGMPVEITSVAWAGQIFYGNVDLIAPVVNSGNRTIQVRVIVANPEGKLRPGMYVNAVVRSPIGQYTETGQEGPAAKPAARRSSALPTAKQEDADAFLATLPPGAEYYVCAMHAQVVSDKPGDCPICGMHLDKKSKGAAPSTVVVPSGEETKEADTFTALASPDAGSTEQWFEGYACPMHPNELSDVPGVCRVCNCGMVMKKWRAERVLAIPETAVIDTGNQKVVYVESAPGVYDAHAVTLGPRVDGYYRVLDGLTLEQRVVARGSFLIDAEARLNPTIALPATAQPAHAH